MTFVRKFTIIISIKQQFTVKKAYLCAMKTIIALICIFALAATTRAQELRRFRLQTWNVENLYDTLKTADRDDGDFLPDGRYGWNTPRYWTKQGHLARTILEAGGLQPVDVVALCEVENDSVVHDLCRRTRLASLGYDYVVSDSPDLRGIDVALIYQPTSFRLLKHSAHGVPHDSLSERPTRDVMLCTGVIPRGDTLDIIVVHFPSRRGGQRATEPYRLRAADVVCRLADSLRAARQYPAIVVMGDCNDEPHDLSLRRIAEHGFVNCAAKARAVDADANAPLPTSALPPRRFRRQRAETPRDKALQSIRGTYFFRQEWSRIDNVLISREGAERYRVGDCLIFAPDYLLETDASGFPLPFRTYRGPIYHGGVSDHLPLVLDLWY